MTDFTRAEQAHEREHAESCPYCGEGPGLCTCEDEHECDRCGAPAVHRVFIESIGGERDERLIEERWLCEECEEREDRDR